MSQMEEKLRAYRLKAIERRLAQEKRCLCNQNNSNMNNSGEPCPEHAMLLPDENIDEQDGEKERDTFSISSNTSEAYYASGKRYGNSWFWLTTKWGVSIIIWLAFFFMFRKIEFGAVFVVLSALVFIYFNTRTGPKPEGEISAYSVFNEGCRSIDGTFTAEQLEKELRYGPHAVG